jgi:aspartate carbamoyltransferase catalytic subunit
VSREDINHVLDLAGNYVDLNRHAGEQRRLLRGDTIIKCFAQSSTRTRASFEVAGEPGKGEASASG